MALLEGLQELGDAAINIQKFRLLGGFCRHPDQKNTENPTADQRCPQVLKWGLKGGSSESIAEF